MLDNEPASLVQPGSPAELFPATDSAIPLLRTTKITSDELQGLRDCVATDLRNIHSRMHELTRLSADRFELVEARLSVVESSSLARVVDGQILSVLFLRPWGNFITRELLLTVPTS